MPAVDVRLDGSAGLFQLPEPPAGPELCEAIRATLRLREALPILLVVAGDVSVADRALLLGDLLGKPLLERVELHPEEDVLLRHAGALEEALVRLIGWEGLLLLVLE